MTKKPDAPTPERIEYELESSKEELASADLVLGKGHLNSAISSSYYACFHAARAVLYQKGSIPTTHKGVMSEFNRILVKTGELSDTWSDILEEQRTERQMADYHSYSRSITKKEVTRLLKDAHRFVDKMEEILNKG